MYVINIKEFSEAVSAEVPDWGREHITSFWSPSQRLLKSIRRYQAATGPFIKIKKNYWVLHHRFWSIVTASDIPINSRIGGGLLLPHPNGVVVHPNSVIGPNCLLFQQVTITSQVEIGGHVDIGSGAKIIGPVKIGDHVQVGANAVVNCDIPARSVAVGIPARIISQQCH